MNRFIKRAYLTFVLFFLYIPIVVLIFYSFNAGKSRAKWEGFSLHWYADLFQDAAILKALYVTLSVAVIAAIIATVLGTLAAIGIHAMRKRPQGFMMTMTTLPMTMPDIVTGISLMILFTFARIERGYVTMLLAHITFNTPFVILSVMPKLKQMNKHTYEAALDLGATPSYALLHVILRKSYPGLSQAVCCVHALAGRFRHQLFYHQPDGAKPLHADLFQGSYRDRTDAQRAERADVSFTARTAASDQPPRRPRRTPLI